ncbi:MAG: FKBP-type peptidyl-prolyl cis-trans isomerase [Bacteroidaceae bacterium]|nr:FKBP-type peptidyl-prolyl cis-trans isomerase [Bacteroidaceae bacterium]
MGIDTTYIADFLKGFESTKLTEADMREKARIAGTEIRNQVENQVYPQASKQVNDSIDILNKVLFLNGFRDGISGQNETISMDSTQALVQKQMEYYHRVNMERKYGANRLAGEEFLKLNAKKDSVKTTESGLQYKILTQGTGEVPVATSRVKVNYEGKLIDGTVFDSSYSRKKPASFGCNQVIKGWTEALTMMPVGSKWEIYIPQQLAYGDREQGKIPPFSTLIFTVELLEIEK